MQKNTKYELAVGFLAILASIFSIYARFTALFPGDLYLTLRLQSIDSHYLLPVMRLVSFVFGGWCSILVVFIISLIIWWRIGRLEAILFPVAGLITLIHTVFKIAIERPRPSADLVKVLSREQDYGFPSGHAVFSILILGLLAYFLFINTKNHTRRNVIMAGMIALIILIGTSRVYLGVHWPSDVIGGYLIGGVLLTALIWFHQVWKANHQIKYTGKLKL
jgi:undecaprenyl-diphosphatase